MATQQELQHKLYKEYGNRWTKVFGKAARKELDDQDRLMLTRATKLGLDVSSIWQLALLEKK